MSADAHHDDSSNSFLGNLIGIAFIAITTLALVVMLGIVGFAFYGKSVAIASATKSAEPAEAEEAATAAAVATPAPAAPAPAATPAAAAAPAGDGNKTPDPAAAPAAGGVDPAQMALGKSSYAMCAACHGPDGKGLKAGPALMAPSLVGSEVLLGNPDAPLLVVLKGIAKEDMKFMGMMAPLAAGLDDEKLAAVLTYVRNEWGNSAPPVTVEQAAAARAKFADVDAPAGIKRADIQKIVDAHK